MQRMVYLHFQKCEENLGQFKNCDFLASPFLLQFKERLAEEVTKTLIKY